MPSLRAAASAAAALLLAASSALPASAQAGGRPGVPVYCWQGSSYVNITSQTDDRVCADLYVVSPDKNPTSNYWETRMTIEGLVLQNSTITNIWRFDPVPGAPGSPSPDSVIGQYKIRSWDVLRPQVPFRALSLCGTINFNHWGFSTSRNIISSDGGHICELSCAAPLTDGFGSGCVWGNWSDTDCGCRCNPGFCANPITGQCTVQQGVDTENNRPISCSIGGLLPSGTPIRNADPPLMAAGSGIQLDPEGQPVGPATAEAPKTTSAAAPATTSRAAAATTSRATSAAPAPTSAPASAPPAGSTASEATPPLIVVTTSTPNPEPAPSKGLSAAAIGGMIAGAVAVAAILVGFVLWRRVSANPAAKTISKGRKEEALEEGKPGDAPAPTTAKASSPKASKVAPEAVPALVPVSAATMPRDPASPISPAMSDRGVSPVTYTPLYQVAPAVSPAGADAAAEGVMFDSGEDNLMSGDSLLPSEAEVVGRRE
ncbi:hypothetical protein DFJ74DRAFT_677753 [Hyaloraphidium curvatum]|nr:hypothetical protein DFJ74DRAFT_677753 [Hyaloraphidium curvatum]